MYSIETSLDLIPRHKSSIRYGHHVLAAVNATQNTSLYVRLEQHWLLMRLQQLQQQDAGVASDTEYRMQLQNG